MIDYFQTDYAIMPQYMTKMSKEFKRRGLDWEGTEWMDGELNGILSGPRDKVIAFLISSQRTYNHKTKRWRKLTPKEALAMMEPMRS